MKITKSSKSLIAKPSGYNAHPNVVSKKILFMGEFNDFLTQISLTNLTPPSEAVASGFSNPAPSDVPLLFNHKNTLRIWTTYKDELKEYVDYLIVDNYKINLINDITTEPGEVFFIEITIPNDADLTNLSANLQAPVHETMDLINFLANSNKAYNAEFGTTGWSTYKDAAQARPEDGIGGTATVISAVSTSATQPLSGARSFLLAKGSGNAQGEGWSVDFQIDRAHFARVLQIEFDYQVESGTFVAGNTIDYTTAGDSDLIVYIYDIDNNQLIEPTTFRLYSNASNIADKFIGNFQTSATGVNYRLIFHVARTSTAAWTLKVDNIVVKPAKYTYGTPITDWQEYTPQLLAATTNPNLGSTGTIRGRWRRVGGNCEINIAVYFNGTGISDGSGAYFLTIPSGLAIDYNRVAETINQNYSTLGSGFYQAGSSVANVRTIVPYVRQADLNRILMGQTHNNPLSHASIPASWVAGNFIHLTASVPIAGWSSSVKISEPMELRDVVFNAIGTFNTSVSALPTYTNIRFGSLGIKDSTNSYNSSTGVFRVPISGYYHLNAHVTSDGTYTSGHSIVLRVTKNSNTIVESFTRNRNSINQDLESPFQINFIEYFNAGDLIEFQVAASSSYTITNSRYTYASITRLPSSQALAQSEVVVVDAWNGTGQTIVNQPSSPATTTQLSGLTKIHDTHNALDTSGIFTAPTAGWYVFNARFGFSGSVYFNAEVTFFLVNAANTTYLLASGAHVQSNARAVTNHTLMYYLKAGEQVRLKLGTWGAGGNRNLSTNPPENFISIYKIN